MRRFLLLSVVFLFLASLTPAKDVQLVGDASVPGAKGDVSIGKDKNGNVKLTLKVRHLAKPSSLTPGKQVYVVWVQGKSSQPEKLGVLQVNNNLEGKLEATTQHREFDLFVTAENDPSTESPTGTQLLHGSIVQ